MAKQKKYSLDYWVKQNRGWSFDKELAQAVTEYRDTGTHAQIEFQGTPLEFANALYLAWMKRGSPSNWYQGFFPTPLPIAARLAQSLDLTNEVVLDPGCGFGNLTHAIHCQTPGVRVIAVERNMWVHQMAEILWQQKVEPVQLGDFLDGWRPKPFDKVIANPPFGKCYGRAAIEYAFMERIANLSRTGTPVAVILPPTFFTKTTKKTAPILERFEIVADEELEAGTFKPLTSVTTHLYLLEVVRGGRTDEVVVEPLAEPAAKTCGCPHSPESHAQTGKGKTRHTVCMGFGCNCGVSV